MPATLPVDWLVGVTTSPVEIRDYLQKHGIEEAAKNTVQLAQAIFPDGSVPHLSLEADCESNERRLIVDIAINAPPEEVFQLFDGFVDAWIDAIPLSAQNQIGLTYSSR